MVDSGIFGKRWNVISDAYDCWNHDDDSNYAGRYVARLESEVW